MARRAQPVLTSQQNQPVLLSRSRVTPAIAIAAFMFGFVILLGALTLWFHYGTAVFFEMISSGIAGCF